MSRILLAWELGGNYGHIGKMVPVVNMLRQNGHEVALVVRDVVTARYFIDATDILILQTPSYLSRKSRQQPVSFADIIANCGFDVFESLAALVSSWGGLFSLFQPDVIVAEYAPLAVFSARVWGIPCLRVDTGFSIPPEISPWPSFRPWLKTGRKQLLEREAKLLTIANQVLEMNGKHRCRYLYEVIRADHTLITSVPELDHYQGRRAGNYIGPLSNLPCEKSKEWHLEAVPRIFAYLRPFPGLRKVLEGLDASGFHAIVVVPGIDQRLIDEFTNDQLVVLDQPVGLEGILKNADLVISHAGHGLSSAALMAGVPSLAIPTQIEQMMLTKTLERLGVGKALSIQRINHDCSSAIISMVADQALHERTREFADKYADYDASRTIYRLVKTIERLPDAINQRR